MRAGVEWVARIVGHFWIGSGSESWGGQRVKRRFGLESSAKTRKSLRQLQSVTILQRMSLRHCPAPGTVRSWQSAQASSPVEKGPFAPGRTLNRDADHARRGPARSISQGNLELSTCLIARARNVTVASHKFIDARTDFQVWQEASSFALSHSKSARCCRSIRPIHPAWRPPSNSPRT